MAGRAPASGGRTSPSYVALEPASLRASEAARASSKKRDTKCEIILRKTLWSRGLRYRVDVKTLPGRPDIVIRRQRVVVFCDGDFWHGRNLEARVAKLKGGHNSAYWVAKIVRNVERDRQNDAKLQGDGWRVLRFWETEILRDPSGVADAIVAAVHAERQATTHDTADEQRPAG